MLWFVVMDTQQQCFEKLTLYSNNPYKDQEPD